MQSVRFFNIGMTNVRRPIIIYSYYNRYGAPDNITPAIAASTEAAAATANTPVWRDILISNVWGTASSGSKRAGIIWGRTEMLAAGAPSAATCQPQAVSRFGLRTTYDTTMYESVELTSACGLVGRPHRSGLAVDVLSMANLHHKHCPAFILNRVSDTVCSASYSILIS